MHDREKRRVGEQIEPGGRPKAPGSEEPRLSETEIGPRNGMLGLRLRRYERVANLCVRGPDRHDEQGDHV